MPFEVMNRRGNDPVVARAVLVRRGGGRLVDLSIRQGLDCGAIGARSIVGRVVDSTTKQPLENIAVEIGGSEVRTKPDGEFEFVPVQQQHYFYVIPLLPFEFWWVCGDDLQFYDIDPRRQSTETRYRAMSLRVNSCPYPSFGAYRREENRDIFEELGDVELRQ